MLLFVSYIFFRLAVRSSGLTSFVLIVCVCVCAFDYFIQEKHNVGPSWAAIDDHCLALVFIKGGKNGACPIQSFLASLSAEIVL